MRAGLLIYGSLDTLSGGYLYDRKLAEHLERAGAEVRVISLPWRSYPLHLSDNLLSRTLRELAHMELDVLLQDELNHPSLFLINRRLKQQMGIPILSIVHHLRCSERHPAPLLALYRAVERRYLRSVDGFIFNSQTTRAVVEALSGVKRPCVVAQPAGSRFAAGVDAAGVQARAQTAGPLQIAFVGNVIPRKGLHTLIEALVRMPPGTWRLTVTGRLDADPRYTRRVRRLIEGQGISGAVRLAGRLPDEALAEQLAGAHVLCVPSSYEGFGIVYLEGMAFGLPAIATTAGAAGEIIEEGRSGYLVPADDPAALADRLGGLHEKRDVLARMSEAALQRFAAHPTWEESTAQIVAFIEQMARQQEPEPHR